MKFIDELKKLVGKDVWIYVIAMGISQGQRFKIEEVGIDCARFVGSDGAKVLVQAPAIQSIRYS